MVEHGGRGGKLLKALAAYTTDHGPKRWMGPDAATSKPRSPSSGLASANADAPEGAKDSLGIAAIALLVAQPRTSLCVPCRKRAQNIGSAALVSGNSPDLSALRAIAKSSDRFGRRRQSQKERAGPRKAKAGVGSAAMYIALQVLTVMLAAITMALSLAHALELPGKLRLSQEQYLAVQPIYYPGLVIGGIAEPAGILAALAL